MALPKEPRQKMINIMYLVLTAILALNVSSEILNAFKTIDESFGKSNKGLAERSEKLVKDFSDDSNKQFAAKVAIWKPRAEKVKEISENIYNQLEALKTDLKKESGQKIPNGPFKEDDLEAATRMFLNGTAGQTQGDKLYSLLSQYKEELKKIDNSLENQVNTLPDFTSIPSTQNNNAALLAMNPAQKWANLYFHMTPSVAAIAILSKFQNDIRNSETQLIEYCYSQINSIMIPINKFGVIANASSSMVMAGDEFSITAGLGAYNNDTRPIITIDGTNIPLNADGQAVYKTTVSTPGDYTKHVTISYKDPSGEQKTTSTDIKYKVGVPAGLAVSTDATRVFYIGAPGGNQLSVSGAAGGAGAIKVNVVSGAATVNESGPGSYKVITSAEGPITLSVSDGKTTSKVVIPSKKLPPPTKVILAGTENFSHPNGGVVGAGEFKLQTRLEVSLPGFILEGVNYTVSSFKMSFSGKGFADTETITLKGASLSGAAALINRCTSGSSVIISDIIALDAAKTEQRMTNTIGFSLK